LQRTSTAPAFGGNVTIGFVGSPHYINPVIAQANEVDRALIKLVYPSLLHYNSQGKLVSYLASRYAVGDQGKTYDVFLRKGVVWEDNQPLTAQDIVFTIKTIQDAKTSSPLARLWQGVKVQALDDASVRFTLPEPYAFFLENLTVGILPQHIWNNINAENFSLSDYNKTPVGAGPYRLSTFTKSESTITSITFKANETFFDRAPYVPKVTVRFYATPQELAKAYQEKEVQIMGISAGALSQAAATITHSNTTAFPLPRYFALFFNENQNPLLRKKEVRQALFESIDRQELVNKFFAGQARVIDSPIPWVLSRYHAPQLPVYAFNPAHAQQLLASAGVTPAKPLSIELSIVNDDSLERVAQAIVANWRSASIKATIRSVDINQLRDQLLQKRTYQAFLFGQALALEPDPFSLWHSSQSVYPGLNLSAYSNKTVDTALEQLRQTFDEQQRIQLFTTFQTQVMQDLPVLFLYSPYYLVFSQDTINGIIQAALSLPEDYLNGITDWYIYTNR